MPDNSDAEIAIESLLNLSGNQNTHNPRKHHQDERNDETISLAPVPKLTRLLRDGKGKFMFIGDSANLSFLQNIRRLVKSSIGDCAFVNDHFRHGMIESTPSGLPQWTGSQDLPAQLRPSAEESMELVHQFFLATSGVIDLFDAGDLPNPSGENEFTNSIFYLVVAIGAQARRTGNDDDLAELYFNHGRQLAMLSFMDDPSVLTIQAYSLITMYMLGASRRNGAFMNLGIAVRAAHALGLHRHDTTALFCPRERRTRERIWKSIRVLDLFLSASLGRPPATSEAENRVMNWNRPSTYQDEDSIDAQSFSAIVSICFIFERILIEVYGKKTVSTNLVESISQQHREWTSALPKGLQIDEIDGTGDNLRELLGRTHLSTSFYWSIILLTRPFLVYRVSAHIKNNGLIIENPEDSSNPKSRSSLISTFADACVDSAVRSIDIIDTLIRQPGIPKNLPLVINSGFVSSLVCGVALFGDFDRSFPLRHSLEKGQEALRFFGKTDPTARRYIQIVTYMRAAVETYVGKRDQREMENRRKLVSHMFGQVLRNPPEPELHQNADVAQGSSPVGQQYGSRGHANQLNGLQFATPNQNSPWYPNPIQQDGGYEPGPNINTSELLADSIPPPNAQTSDQVFTVLPPYAESGIRHLSPDSSSLPSYAEEIPLFSIMNEFDPLMNGNYMLGTG
jgi:hypothetical protein